MEQNSGKQKTARHSAVMILAAVSAVVFMSAAVLAGIYFWQEKHVGSVNDRQGNVVVDNTTVDAGIDTDGNDLSSRRVYFAGFEDSVFNDRTKLELKNPQENEDFYMMYRILDAGTGEVFYESGLIESGRALYWEPAQKLAPGTWHLSIQMMPYYSPDSGVTWTPLTSTDNRVVFTVLGGSTDGSEDDGEGKTSGR